ncbi:MAG: putative DNA binding domain-containing protein, partial [Deltaproteobacteria bacterium]|nr:putative DNA binding domain-containing protein [Deltaproteobacteria bacterium]
MCKCGKVPDAIRFGKSWAIPDDAKKPTRTGELKPGRKSRVETKASYMESQNIEWKASWSDESLKLICAFANANGGTLEIGRDGKGAFVGLSGVKKLMEDIPNKIRRAMGIVADVELHCAGDKDYIVIGVKPYTVPISCNGKYYCRSGASTQELSGTTLNEFMLRKLGKTWDDVPVPYVRFDDFESDAFKVFRRKAIASGRMTAKD